MILLFFRDVNPDKVKDYVDFLIKNEIDGVFGK